MKDAATIDIRKLHARARLPKYFRIAAVVGFVAVLLAVGIGFYRANSNTEFRMTGFPTELSKDVVATVSNYERREVEGGSVKYYIKADQATTFTDNHQELENVYLQVFNEDGTYNELTAAKAIYVPSENKEFTGYFAGNVHIVTSDDLNLNTEQITYDSVNDTSTAEETVTFQRANIYGRSFGAVLHSEERSVQLKHDVKIEIAQPDGGTDTLASGNAVYSQNTGTVVLEGGVTVVSQSSGGDGVRNEVSSNRAKIILEGPTKDALNYLKTAEFNESVNFVQTSGTRSTTMTCAYAFYNKPADRLDLKGTVVIESNEAGNVTRTITGDSGVYSSTGGRAEIIGNAQVVAGTDLVKGDRIDADLTSSGTIAKAVVTGNAYLKQDRNSETTEVSSSNLTGIFDDQGNVTEVQATGRSEIKNRSVVDNGTQLMTIVAATGINSSFNGPGAMEKLVTNGRTTIYLESPNNGRDSSNKQVAADQVVSTFNTGGKSLKRVEAIGNADFSIDPHQASESNNRVKVTASRFDCDFYPTGNAPSICVGTTAAKMVRTPTVTRAGRGEQVVNASTLTSRFQQTGGNITQMDAVGKARFSELDRNASAEMFDYTAIDEVVRLRGGDPTAWDSQARVKSNEIDWDTKRAFSNYRGSVSATYYSSKGLGNSSPFSSNDKPVYITSEAAEMNHSEEIAQFSGNARAWQGGSYVRASSIIVNKKDSTMFAEGDVRSVIFSTKPGGSAEVPVFVSAEKMHYDGQKRTVTYAQDVSVKKGTDQINGRSSIVWLNEKNEMTATDFENDVIIIQPGRKANADQARYTSTDEKMVLRGRPARVEDAEKGSMSGAELTLYLKDKRVFGTGATQENPTGRVRNTYKIQ